MEYLEHRLPGSLGGSGTRPALNAGARESGCVGRTGEPAPGTLPRGSSRSRLLLGTVGVHFARPLRVSPRPGAAGPPPHLVGLRARRSSRARGARGAMGNSAGRGRSDFEWVYSDQPHTQRRKEMLGEPGCARGGTQGGPRASGSPGTRGRPRNPAPRGGTMGNPRL